MKFSFSVSIDKFDKVAYKKALDETVRQTFIKAGQKFLLAAIPRIPIWTGMLRGAFRNLEDLVGKVESTATGTRIRGTAKGSSKNTPSNTRSGFYNGIRRTPQAGRQFATESTKIIDVSGASLATGRTAYYFKFEVNISYFDLLDEKRGWRIWKAANEAFETYVKANLELPDPLQYTTRKIIKSS